MKKCQGLIAIIDIHRRKTFKLSIERVQLILLEFYLEIIPALHLSG